MRRAFTFNPSHEFAGLRFVVLCLVGGILAFASTASAQTTVQPPAALNHNAVIDIGSNSDEFVDLATDENGTWIAVWHAPADDTTVDCTGAMPSGTCGPDLDIMFAVSDDAGDTWSTTRYLNTDARTDSSTDADPKITTDGKGNWVVVWIRGVGGAVSRSVDDGQTWSAPATIPNLNLTGTVLTDTHELVTDRRGVWNLIWASDAQGTGGDLDIFLTRSTDNGLTWSASLIEVNSASTDDSLDVDSEPALETDGLGNWVAVWDSTNDSAGRGADADILASSSFDGGLTWSPPVNVNSDATTDSGAVTLAEDRDPTIATDQRGQWVVVWHEYQDASSSTGTDSDILYSSSTNVGTSWSAELPVDPNAATDGRDDLRAVIQTDLSGTWQVAWEASVLSPLSDVDLLLSTSLVTGTAWSTPVLLNTNAVGDTGNDVYPDLEADGGGNWIAVWSSTDDLGSTIFGDWDILFTTFSAIPQFPENDLSFRARDIFTNTPLPGTLVAATTDGGSTCTGSTDVWYRFTPPAPGIYDFDTCGTHDLGGTDSGTDTVVSLHSGEPGTGANEIACNDDWTTGQPVDACSAVDTGQLRDSSLEVVLATTNPVWVRVANYSGTPQADFKIEVPEPSRWLQLAGGCAGLMLISLRSCQRGRC